MFNGFNCVRMKQCNCAHFTVRNGKKIDPYETLSPR